MERRVSTLPTGRGYPAPSALPLYMSDHQQNTDSTGSQESIMTQVPLPYHMPETYERGSSYFATPELPSHGTFEPFGASANTGRSNSTSLNPTSTPYVPPESGYSQAFDPNNNSRNPNNLPQQPLPPMASQGLHLEQQQYYGQNAYLGDMGGAVIPPLGDGQFQPQYDAFQGSYGRYASGQGMNEYQPHGYGMSAQVLPPTQYTQATGVASPTTSYASPSTQGWATMPYAQPQLQGAQGQGWGQAYGRQNQYGAQLSAQKYVLPSNANRGKSAIKSTQRDGNQSNNRSSNNGSTSRTSANNQKQKGGQHKYGGPVLPPASKAGGCPSPTQSKASQASSSQGFQSQAISRTISHAASEDGEKSISDLGSPTPAAKPRKGVDVASLPRPMQTPTLRSRRGQSIHTSATDPSRKSTADWLNKLPDRAPPPKMMSLLTNVINGHEVARLRTISESDPFTGTPRSGPRGNLPLLSSSFAPLQLAAAYNGPNSGMSLALRMLTENGKTKPSVDQALDTRNLPFVEYCRMAKVDEWGVIKIKNIPYGCNRPEVLAFLGRNARIINEQDYEPVHIVMERVTSKTLDCYVEFINFNEAVAAVNRFETNRSGGRGGRLGQRHVEVELSSQEALMKDLFPKAKNVHWEGSKPTIFPTDPTDKYNSGFQGFISKEELVMLVKHVEAPQRSPFSKECPQRPFECLISTLLKYPWYMVDYITIEDRNLLFQATIRLLDLLRDRLSNTRDGEMDVNLTPMLFKRAWRAALKCPGFTPTMKDTVVYKCHVDESLAQEIGVPLFAAEYKYLWTIGPKPGVPHDLILWYAAIIREYTSHKEQLSLAEKAAKGEEDAEPKLFGDLEKYFGHPKDNEGFEHMTLAQVAANEWAGLETVLRQALTPALKAPGSI